MVMAQFKLGFRNRSVPEQLTICENALRNISGLDTPRRRSVDLGALRDTVVAARESEARVQQLRLQLREQITRRNDQMRRARDKVYRACTMVAANVGLERGAMAAAGLELEGSKRPAGPVGEPMFVRAESKTEGAVHLRWKRPVRHCAFEVQLRADTANPDDWQRCDTQVRQSCIIRNLAPGVKYWFRVRAVNAHGYGPWSQMASARVK